MRGRGKVMLEPEAARNGGWLELRTSLTSSLDERRWSGLSFQSPRPQGQCFLSRFITRLEGPQDRFIPKVSCDSEPTHQQPAAMFRRVIDSIRGSSLAAAAAAAGALHVIWHAL
jgi:hypothetical protein